MYYLKKLLKGIFSIYIISTISFFLISLIPGDPATAILGIDAEYERILEFRKNFGLDEDLLTRYINWFKDLIKGDFGISYRYNIPVSDLILDSLFITMVITIISLLIIFFISTLFAFYLDKVKNKRLEKIYEVILGLFIAIPQFWLGIISIFVFSVLLRILSIGYNGTYISLIIPSFIISIPHIGIMTINLKENIYKEKRADYIKFLYSNGMDKKYLNIYVLKNAIITVLPLFGLIVINLITGIVIVESVFSIPGIGKLMLLSVNTRDIKLLQALIIYTSFAVILINLIIDFMYGILDKRIRISGK